MGGCQPREHIHVTPAPHLSAFQELERRGYEARVMCDSACSGLAPLCQARGFGAGREGRLLGREACRVISSHPVLTLR